MQITITPGPLSGAVTPPPSKSQAHRVLIAAALAGGVSEISHPGTSQDIDATLDCLAALGAGIRRHDGGITVTGLSAPATHPVLPCGESGSTLRFLMPVALVCSGGGEFRGRGRLMQRPQTPYFEIFRQQGVSFTQEGDTLTLSGRLSPGTYRLPGNVSSQFVTGLLYALPLLAGDSDIVLTTALESESYVGMTLEALEAFGVTVRPTETGWHVPGNQVYTPRNMAVEGDWSQAAFYLCAAGLGNPVSVSGLRRDSRQGDRVVQAFSERLRQPGAVTLDVGDCPDLVPALAAQAALRDGDVTHITGAARLRLKESDRLASVTAVLSALGADITEEPSGLRIRGAGSLRGGVTVDAWNDHRIAMMAAVAATRCRLPVSITGAECVRKSYPAFWRDYEALGGILEETV